MMITLLDSASRQPAASGATVVFSQAGVAIPVSSETVDVTTGLVTIIDGAGAMTPHARHGVCRTGARALAITFLLAAPSVAAQSGPPAWAVGVEGFASGLPMPAGAIGLRVDRTFRSAEDVGFRLELALYDDLVRQSRPPYSGYDTEADLHSATPVLMVLGSLMIGEARAARSGGVYGLLGAGLYQGMWPDNLIFGCRECAIAVIAAPAGIAVQGGVGVHFHRRLRFEARVQQFMHAAGPRHPVAITGGLSVVF